jgi:hypothetical protein
MISSTGSALGRYGADMAGDSVDSGKSPRHWRDAEQAVQLPPDHLRRLNQRAHSLICQQPPEVVVEIHPRLQMLSNDLVADAPNGRDRIISQPRCAMVATNALEAAHNQPNHGVALCDVTHRLPYVSSSSSLPAFIRLRAASCPLQHTLPSPSPPPRSVSASFNIFASPFFLHTAFVGYTYLYNVFKPLPAPDSPNYDSPLNREPHRRSEPRHVSTPAQPPAYAPGARINVRPERSIAFTRVPPPPPLAHSWQEPE